VEEHACCPLVRRGTRAEDKRPQPTERRRAPPPGELWRTWAAHLCYLCWSMVLWRYSRVWKPHHAAVESEGPSSSSPAVGDRSPLTRWTSAQDCDSGPNHEQVLIPYEHAISNRPGPISLLLPIYY
jgi:hypothetical protein